MAFSTLFLAELTMVQVIECYVDDTKGLEHAGLKLYAMPGLVHGKAVPVSYFVCGSGNEGGDTTRWVQEWFLAILNHHTQQLVPYILFSDKDQAQISADKSIWGPEIVRLCQWHVHDAIKWKLQTDQRTAGTTTSAEADILLLDLANLGVEIDRECVDAEKQRV